MKKWRQLLVMIGLALASCKMTHAWQAPTMMISNNRLIYEDVWPEHITSIDDYYAKVLLAGQWRRTNIHEKNYVSMIEGSDPRFKLISASKVVMTADQARSYIHFNTTASNYLPSITYTIPEEDLDFATFSVTYRVTNYGTYKKMKPPLFSLEVCGSQPLAFGGDTGSSMDGKISVPNPGCSSDNREIKITALRASSVVSGSNYARVQFYSFNFNLLPQLLDAPIVLKRHDGQEFAYVRDDDIYCQDTSCPVPIDSEIWVGDVVDGEMMSMRLMPIDRYERNYRSTAEILVSADQLIKETDDSLTAVLTNSKFKNANRLVRAVLGISQNGEQLLSQWADVHQITETAREDLGGIAYQSPTQGWQVANFPVDESAWETGFYAAVRFQDSWGHFTPATDVYHCQKNKCTPTTIKLEKPVYFSQVDFGEASGEAQVVVNLSNPTLDLDRFVIYERQDEGWQLSACPDDYLYYGEIYKGEYFVRCTLPEMSREGGHYYLYDRDQDQIIDELEYTQVTGDYDLIRDTAVWEWKENYVSR